MHLSSPYLDHRKATHVMNSDGGLGLGPVISPGGAPSGVATNPMVTMPLHRRLLLERQTISAQDVLESRQSWHNLRRINEATGTTQHDTDDQNGTGTKMTPSLHPFAGDMTNSVGSNSSYWVSLPYNPDGSLVDPTNIPEGRRGHHSTMWSSHATVAKDGKGVVEEFMIVSGGFTDFDWATFPIYAFSTKTNLWLDLSAHLHKPDSSVLDNCKQSTVRPDSPSANSVDKDGNTINLWDYAMSCPPPPRMSHFTLVHSDHLYLFGGLLYNDHSGMFFQEERDFVYRIDLHYLLLAARDGLPPGMAKVEWERILPRVIIPPSSPSGQTPVTSSALAGNTASSTSSNGNNNAELATGPNRGEMKGGYWDTENKVIIYGGLRVHDTPRDALGLGRQVDTPLSDIWSYDLNSDTWERVMPKRSTPEKLPTHPTARTSHAVDVTGDALVVYGGMKKVEENMWDGSTIWSDLSDVLIFNLTTQEWHQRIMYPTLARAYHTIVAWNDPNVTGPIFCAFGGYASSID